MATGELGNWGTEERATRDNGTVSITRSQQTGLLVLVVVFVVYVLIRIVA